jgi:Ca2+-binding RTX toxin-like protein
MANFFAAATPAVNFNAAFDNLAALANPYVAYGEQTANGFKAYVANVAAVTIGGSQFTYSGVEPTGGTVTSIAFKVNGAAIGTLSGLSVDFANLVASIDTAGVDAVMQQLLSGDDTIVGSSLGDALFGKEGDDTISGLSGADRLYGDAGEDTLYGGLNDDQLFGGADDDRLHGDEGNDILVGGAGHNDLDGGTGVDTARFTDQTAAVRVTLNGSAEAFVHIGNFIRGTVKNVENLVGGGGDDALTGDGFENSLSGFNGDDTLRGGGADDELLGGDGNDTLIGGSGNDELRGSTGHDLLDGGVGSDEMDGGSGDDTYVVDYTGDTVIELAGKGTDDVLSSATFTLTANVENLTLTGAAAIDATGNELANVLRGNAADNRLDGKGGADAMSGGGGDDGYVIDNAGDVVTEKAGEGHDSVAASVSFALGAEVEDLRLLGSGNLDATGNALANVLTGNAGGNHLTGGLGHDVLAGGEAADSFVFDAKAGKKNADTILDFEAGVDHLVLDGGVFGKLNDDGVLKGKFFAFGHADDGNDYLIYREGSGKLLYDRDGDGGKAAKLVAILEGGPDLHSGDVLIA